MSFTPKVGPFEKHKHKIVFLPILSVLFMSVGPPHRFSFGENCTAKVSL